MLRALWLVIVLTFFTGPLQAARTSLENVPFPEDYLHRMAVDTDGTLWALSQGNTLYCLKSGRFEAAVWDKAPPQRVNRFFSGDRKRGLFVGTGDQSEPYEIYQLKEGRALWVTTAYRDSRNDEPLLVTGSGRLLNWGQNLLAVFHEGKWIRTEADFDSAPTPMEGGSALRVVSYSRMAKQLTIYTLNEAEGKWEKVSVPQPRGPSPVVLPWDGDIVVVAEWLKEFSALDLRSGKRVELRDLKPSVLWERSGFAAPGGEVWWVPVGQVQFKYLLRLSKEGTPVEFQQATGGGDASEIIRTAAGSFVRTDTKVLEVCPVSAPSFEWSWKNGLPAEARRLVGGAADSFWILASGKLFKATLGTELPPESALTQDWEEFASGRGEAWNLGRGLIALVRKERPEELAVWDGKRWTARSDIAGRGPIFVMAADDRGNLLCLRTGQGAESFFLVGPDSAERFESLRALAEAVFKRGATYVQAGRSAGSLTGTVQMVKERGGKIWLVDSRADSVEFFEDGWKLLKNSAGVRRIFESAEFGVLLGFHAGTEFGKVEDGAFKRLEGPGFGSRRFLVGPQGLQPYDRKLLDGAPGRYYPLFEDGRFFCPNADRFEALLKEQGVGGQAFKRAGMPQIYVDRVLPAPSGGAWVHEYRRFYRVFGEAVLAGGFAGLEAPLSTFSKVLEDCEGNLWFRGDGNVFLYRQSRCRISVPPGVARCGRQLTLPVSVEPARMADGITFFSRINGGGWEEWKPAKPTSNLRFATSGNYHCEITAIRAGGRLNTLAFDVAAEVALPETKLKEPAVEPLLVNTLRWFPAVEAVASAGSEEPVTLVWRIGDGAWQAFNKDSGIPLARLPEGPAEIQFAAGEGFWRDITPLVLKINVRPDFALIARSLLEAAQTEDPHFEALIAEAAPWSEQLLPLMENEAENARAAAALQDPLEQLIRSIQSTIQAREPKP